MEKEKRNKKVKKQNAKNLWPLKVFIMAVTLSLSFSLLSEFLMSKTGIVIALIVIVVFVSISIITDLIGVAVTACSAEPFRAMSSKKIRGAKEGLMLIRNADKVASLSADILGDVCGVLSGAAGASIVLKLTSTIENAFLNLLIASAVTAIIAGATICGKAICKKVAMNNCNSIILFVGKVISMFTKQGNKKSKSTKSKKNTNESNKE